MVNMEQASREELLARIAELEAGAKTGSGYRVSAKGGLSRYGLSRFPVTLYASQWRKIIADVKSGVLEAELAKHATRLSEKPSAAE